MYNYFKKSLAHQTIVLEIEKYFLVEFISDLFMKVNYKAFKD